MWPSDRRIVRRKGGLTVMGCMIDGYSLRVHTPVPYSVPVEPDMPFTAMMAAAIRASRDTGVRCTVVDDEGEEVLGFDAGGRA